MSIRERTREIVARPAADGKYYSPEARAVNDRVTLLKVGDALANMLRREHGPRRRDMTCWCGKDPCEAREALIQWIEAVEGDRT